MGLFFKAFTFLCALTWCLAFARPAQAEMSFYESMQKHEPCPETRQNGLSSLFPAFSILDEQIDDLIDPVRRIEDELTLKHIENDILKKPGALAPYSKALWAASRAFDVDVEVLACLIAMESSFRSQARNSKGTGAGLAQINPKSEGTMDEINRIVAGPRMPRYGSGLSEKAQVEVGLHDGWNRYWELLGEKSTDHTRKGRRPSSVDEQDLSDPDLGIGLAAMWFQYGWEMISQDQKLDEKKDEDLAILAGAYNMGINGFQRRCSPKKYSHPGQCIKKFPMESQIMIDRVLSCMRQEQLRKPRFFRTRWTPLKHSHHSRRRHHHTR